MIKNVVGAVIKRDGGRCVECDPKFQNNLKLNVHHVLPRMYGGTDDASNLVTLCEAHHSARHSELQTIWKREGTFHLYYRHFVNIIRNLLGLHEKIYYLPLLKYLTGSNRFRGEQEKIINNILSRKNTFIVMPTGFGKSLCYQIPGILSDKFTLVISPLKSLMKDQTDFLLKKLIPATYINSDLEKEDVERRINYILKGLFKFTFVTPERYFNPYKNYILSSDHPLLFNKFNLLVVDEAHCIDKWGRNFKPAYAKLGELKNNFDNITTVAMTASASKRVQNKILDSLDIKEADVFVSGFYRPEIKLKVVNWQKQEYRGKSKEEIIFNLVVRGNKEKTIIFVPTINIGKGLLKYFERHNIKSEFYHAKIDKKEKVRIQDSFADKYNLQSNLLIATSAFGI